MTSSRTRIVLAAAAAAALAVTPVLADGGAPRDSVVTRIAPPEPRVRALQTGLLRADRLQHASLAFTLGVGAGLATRETPAAVALPLGLGLLKELNDTRGTGFDTLDLVADVAGALAAGWLIARRP